MRLAGAIAGTLAAAALTVAAPTTAAAARAYAPVDRPGPPLSVSQAQLEKNVICRPDVSSGAREPVLLVPGTTLRPSENFSWNYERAFAGLGIPYCTVELPDHAMGDVQTAAEYVVYAIRHAHDLSGRNVQILGYSQGGMVPRWALRFWPDTRVLVDDDIGIDASNHGTKDSEYCSGTRSCPAAFWQQADTAAFIAALNSYQETFPGISYTEIYSRTDEVVTPNFDDSGSSSVHGGGGTIRNVAVQEICPADVSDHLAMGTYDPVGYALALDALTHDGPANSARIDLAVCAQAFQPGVDPATFPSDYAAYLAAIGQGEQASPALPAEPQLRCYVFADCPMQTVLATHKAHHRKRHRRHGHRHHKRATRHARPAFAG